MFNLRLDPGFKKIEFNQIDTNFNVDRKSHHGDYSMVPFNKMTPVLVPQNPVGRTGLCDFLSFHYFETMKQFLLLLLLLKY